MSARQQQASLSGLAVVAHFLSPIVAGFMFQAGLGLQAVAVFMASGALIGAISLIILGYKVYRGAETAA